MNKKSTFILHRIGIAVIILSVAMLLFGISIFSYRGPKLNSLIQDVGQFSFTMWLPTLIFGIVLVVKNSSQSKRQVKQ